MEELEKLVAHFLNVDNSTETLTNQSVMPAKSAKQARFMQMCAHSPSKAYKKCPPKKVAREFMHLKKAGK